MAGNFSIQDDKGNQIFGQEIQLLNQLKNLLKMDTIEVQIHCLIGHQRFLRDSGGSFPQQFSYPSNLNLDGYPGINSKLVSLKIFPEDQSDITNYNSNLLSSTPEDKLSDRRLDYTYFRDISGKQFTHLLDYFQDQNGKIGHLRDLSTVRIDSNGTNTFRENYKDIYLGSFFRTLDDNEDPTIHGYDIMIKWNNSPLFNGEIDNFINQFSGYNNSEIS
jgi:hypothetical protein